MPELNIQNIANDAQSSVLAPKGYWHMLLNALMKSN